MTWGCQLGNSILEAHGYYELSIVALYQGDYQRQQTLLLRALPLAQQQGDRHEQTIYLDVLGSSLKMQHAYVPAQAYFEEALALVQTLDASRYTIQREVLVMQGHLHRVTGDWAAARTAYQAAYTLSRQTNHLTE